MRRSLRFPPILTSLALIACGGGATTSYAPPEAEPPSEADVAAAVRDALGGDWEAHYFRAFVDLDGDGRQEVIALVAGPMICGTGGCPLFIFSPGSEGLRRVSQVSVVQPPIRVSMRSMNGWRNLVVGVGGGGMPSGNAELEFDGEGYPFNATVDPARPVVNLEDTEIVIPDFDSYRDGEPVSSASAGKAHDDPSRRPAR